MASYTQTTNYGFYKPARRVRPWHTYINDNLDSIDSLIKALSDICDVALTSTAGNFNSFEEKDNYVGDDILLIEDSVADENNIEWQKKKISLDLIFNKAKEYTDKKILIQYFLEPILDKDLTAPPASPIDKDRYIVGSGATGDWEGYDNQIAEYNADTEEWDFTDVKAGAFCFVLDESKLYYFVSSWSEFSSGGGGGLPAFSVSFNGNLYVSTSAYGFIDWVDSNTITRVDIQVGTAPVDATLIVDIHKNGTTIFTTQTNRPMITTGNTTGYTITIEVAGLVNGDRLEFFVDQVGSTTPGANLGIRVSYS